MAKQNINVGTAANDKKGDSLRAAFVKVNANFTELYTELGLVNDVTLSLGAFEFAGSTISTTDSTAIVIDQATTVTSNLNVGGDILPSVANGGDLGSSTLPWRSLYVSNNTIFLGGTALSVNGAGNLLVNGSLITGGTTSYNDLSDKPNLGSYATQNDINTVLNEIDTRVTTISYNDLLDKPNLADTFSFNVAADDSTQKVISNNELIKFIGAGGITTASDAEGYITITQGTTSSLVNGASTASLGSDGALTIPGDIKSNGNINIDINLADSTLRRWQFGEDGNLVVPGDINLSGGTISQYSQNGLTGLKLVANADQGQNVTIMGTGNNTFPILNYVGTTLSGITIGTPEGDWNFMNGNLTIPGDIRSDGNINIDINLADSTLRRWQFGEDGDTVFPNNVSINYSGGNIQFPRIIADSGKAFSVQGQGTSGSAALSWTVNPDAAGQYAAVAVSRGGGDNLAKVVIQAQSNSGDDATAKTWRFDETGALTLPGDIRSEGNINIDINLADSTLRRWQFGEDGELTFPDGTSQTTAYQVTKSITHTANLLAGPSSFGQGSSIAITDNYQTERVSITNSLGDVARATLANITSIGKIVILTSTSSHATSVDRYGFSGAVQSASGVSNGGNGVVILMSLGSNGWKLMSANE